MGVQPPPSVEDGHTAFVAETCARCGRRFPFIDGDDPKLDRFCEPCRAALWLQEQQATHEDAP